MKDQVKAEQKRMIKILEKAKHSASYLYIHGFMTEAERRKAKKRIDKRATEEGLVQVYSVGKGNHYEPVKS